MPPKYAHICTYFSYSICRRKLNTICHLPIYKIYKTLGLDCIFTIRLMNISKFLIYIDSWPNIRWHWMTLDVYKVTLLFYHWLSYTGWNVLYNLASVYWVILYHIQDEGLFNLFYLVNCICKKCRSNKYLKFYYLLQKKFFISTQPKKQKKIKKL